MSAAALSVSRLEAAYGRAQVLFDATLVIDPMGTLRVFLLPDTAQDRKSVV